MTYEPYTEAAAIITRATLPADHPSATHPAHVESPSPARIARLLYAGGYRAAVLAGTDGQFLTAIARVLTDAGLRIGEELDRRPEALGEVRAALRVLCAAGIAAPHDPEHESAVRAESANCCRPVRARGGNEGAE